MSKLLGARISQIKSSFVWGTIGIILSVNTLYASPPQLNWVGTGSFVEKGVYPLVGNEYTSYIFMVNYTDDENNPPLTDYPQVFVYKEVPSESLTLNEIDSTDINYKDGKLYGAYTESNKFVVGTYSYYFEAADDEGTATGPATIHQTGMEIGEYNTVPTLTNDNVIPSSGNAGTPFTYYVTYIDKENNPLDIDNSLLYIDNILSALLNEVDPQDKDYTDGKDYCVNNISFDTIGTHSFYFTIYDLSTDKVVFTSTKDGPTILTENHAPTLTNPILNPYTGNIGTSHQFQITYTDLDNNPPQNPPEVRIWGTETATELGIVLKEIDPLDFNYTDGKLYGTSTIFLISEEEEMVELYHHQFTVLDYLDATVTTTVLMGPDRTAIQTSPTFGSITLFPDTGNIKTLFIYEVVYIDAENNPPEDSYPKLHILDKSENEICTISMEEVNISDRNYMDGKLYRVGYSNFSIGQYKYYFEIKDNIKGTGQSSIFEGPIVSSGLLDELILVDEQGNEINIVNDIPICVGNTLKVFVRGLAEEVDQGPVVATWIITGEIGTITPDYGTFTLFTAGKVGSGTLIATLGTISVGVNLLVLTISSITIVDDNDEEVDYIKLSIGDTYNLYLRGYDDEDHSIYVKGTWSITGGIGILTETYGSSTIFNPTTVGVGTITATYREYTDSTEQITVYTMGAITGHVVFDLPRINMHTGILVTALGLNSGTSTITDIMGYFMILHIDAGTYTVEADAPGASIQQWDNVIVSEGSITTLGTLTLLNADTNNDSSVNITDFNNLCAGFFKHRNETNWSGEADFNGDGLIDTTDFGYLRVNYGKTR